jgi:hypothetical protein
MFNANETKREFTMSDIKGNISLENSISDYQKMYFIRKHAHLFGENFVILTGDLRQLGGTGGIFLCKG